MGARECAAALAALDVERANVLEALGNQHGTLARLQPEIDSLRSATRLDERTTQVTQPRIANNTVFPRARKRSLSHA